MTAELEHRDLPVAVNVDRPMTVQEIKAQQLIIQRVLDEVMVDGIHYGVIPGTEKPTLYQAGAEKICATFRLAPRYDVEDLSEPHNNFYRFRVKCSIHTIRDSYFVGSAVGEASSAEEKYAWERALNEAHYEATDPSRRRIKFKRKFRSDDVEMIHQVQRNAADLANTVLKMAAKRALISATRSATAASDLLDVDLEEEAVADIARTEREAEPKPKAKPKGQPERLIPYGPAKGQRISEADTDHLRGFVEGQERALAQGKIQPQFIESNKALVALIKAELATRESDQPQNPRPLMEDGTWADFCIYAQEECVNSLDATLNEFKVKALDKVPVERRWAFYDSVNAKVSAVK